MNARRTSAAKTTVNLRRRGVLAVAGTAVIAAASLGATATAYAKKSDDTRKDVRKSVACGATGTLKLKAKAEEGNRLELEAEVDSNKAGQEWTVTLTSDGKTVWTGKRITAGVSGSFSVETTVAADGSDATPTASPTTSTTTTPSPTTSDDSSSTSTASPTTSDDSSSTVTASPTTTDDSGHVGLRAASSKGGDDKPGDDKGSKPTTGKHVIGVTATLDTLTCATELTM